MECMGVYGRVHECTWVHMSLFQCTWVYVSVMSLCDCKEFLWLSWVYVSECEGYDCIWVYLTVFESMGVYVSVCECIWVFVNIMSVFECCMNINFATFPEPHTEFRHHRSTSVQTHLPRFRIPARTVTKIGIWIFPNTPKSAGWWANFGIFHELTKPAYWSPTHLHQL